MCINDLMNLLQLNYYGITGAYMDQSEMSFQILEVTRAVYLEGYFPLDGIFLASKGKITKEYINKDDLEEVFITDFRTDENGLSRVS